MRENEWVIKEDRERELSGERRREGATEVGNKEAARNKTEGLPF